MQWGWPFRRTHQADSVIFLLHLDDISTVSIRREVDRTYTVTARERIDTVELVQMCERNLTLFDACLMLGVIMGMHAGEYMAQHGEQPPYLAKLSGRLRRVRHARGEDQ